MEQWKISDKRVVEAIRANGFTCEKPGVKPVSAAISFHFQSLEEERVAKEANIWYETDCPIEWGKTYTLSDGTAIRSVGTSIVLTEQ